MNRPSARIILFGVFAVLAALVCVRLGIWQLDRRAERRARNSDVAAMASMAPASLADLRGRDSAQIHYRHVRFRGVAEYEREMVLAARAQSGAPGVHLVTPVRPISESYGDTLVMLLRGFVYAPDGRTVNLTAAREADTLDVDGLVTVYPPPRAGLVKLSGEPTAIRMLNADTIAALLGQPVAPFVVLVLGDTVPRAMDRPARIPPPSLSEGPHFSYAMQWFSFAAVFLIGFVAFARAGRQRPAAPPP